LNSGKHQTEINENELEIEYVYKYIYLKTKAYTLNLNNFTLKYMLCRSEKLRVLSLIATEQNTRYLLGSKPRGILER
jgi:hypothetical protein